MSTVFDFSVNDGRGDRIALDAYRGKVLLIVNVASQCGFTPQYEGLQNLYSQYRDRGLVVLAFPCNQFGSQEPGNDAEIQSFCQGRFGVQFPVMAKIEVNGEGADPLYVHLKKNAPGILGTESIKWNFTKFLVDKEGKVFKRYAPQDSPEKMSKAIEGLL